jgi:hypothetical protein
VTCQWCTKYGHTCSGDAGKTCGRCIRDRQACISPEGESSLSCIEYHSTNPQVVIVSSESKRRAAAKAEKDRKAKEKAKEVAKQKKVAPSVAGSSKPSKAVLRESLLFSSQ